MLSKALDFSVICEYFYELPVLAGIPHLLTRTCRCATPAWTRSAVGRAQKKVGTGRTNYRTAEKSGNGLFILVCARARLRERTRKICARGQRAALNSALDYHLQAHVPAAASDAFVLSNSCNNYSRNALRSRVTIICNLLSPDGQRLHDFQRIFRWDIQYPPIHTGAPVI